MKNVLALLVAAWISAATEGAVAQTSLPAQVQADLLIQRIDASVAEGRAGDALRAIEQYRKLGVKVPLPLLILEARLANIEKDPLRARKAVTEYLAAPEARGEKSYGTALALYSDLERQIEAEADKERIEERSKSQIIIRHFLSLQQNYLSLRSRYRSSFSLSMIQQSISEASNPGSKTPDAELARYYILSGDLQKAIQHTERVQSGSTRAGLISSMAGKIDGAQLQQLINKIDTSNTTGKTQFDFSAYGTMYAAAGQKANALKMFGEAKRIVQLRPTSEHWNYMHSIVDAMFDAGLEAEARELLIAIHKTADKTEIRILGEMDARYGRLELVELAEGQLAGAEEQKELGCFIALHYAASGDIGSARRYYQKSSGSNCSRVPLFIAKSQVIAGESSAAAPITGGMDWFEKINRIIDLAELAEIYALKGDLGNYSKYIDVSISQLKEYVRSEDLGTREDLTGKAYFSIVSASAAAGDQARAKRVLSEGKPILNKLKDEYGIRSAFADSYLLAGDIKEATALLQDGPREEFATKYANRAVALLTPDRWRF